MALILGLVNFTHEMVFLGVLGGGGGLKTGSSSIGSICME